MQGSPDVIPAVADQPASADAQYQFDLSAVVADDETILSYVAALTDLSLRGQPAVTLADLPTLDGRAVSQRVRAVLVPGRAYRLAVQINPSGSSDVRVFALGIRCPW